MSATKVKLRKRTLPSGKITLYLDFYPPVRNPKTLELSRREYLGIYLKSNPRTIQDREDNAEKIRIAEGIRATREISILNHQFGFIDRSTPKMDFLAWYRSQVEKNNKNWAFAYNYFYQYVDGHCTMGDITLELCKGFREYLLSAKLIKNEKKQLNQNSSSGYWSTFRALLAIAYREHYIKENVNEYLEGISDVETRREYLTLEELRDLADTPCEIPVLKAASLFSCLTGLRISDILALRWENVEQYPDGGACLRLKTEKTDTETTLPIFCRSPGALRKTRQRTRLQRPRPADDPPAAQGLARGCRHRQAHHFPLLPAHQRHSPAGQRHRHLHRIQDAHPPQRGHHPDLYRSDGQEQAEGSRKSHHQEEIAL